jgi:hypothetical protein
MVQRWVGNVQYHEYTPLTMLYDPPLDAFTVARADIDSPDRRHRLALEVVVASSEVSTGRVPSLDEVIQRARTLLECLVAQYRTVAEELTGDALRVFDLTGQRLR